MSGGSRGEALCVDASVLGTIVGGPFFWACKASQLLRPVDDEEEPCNEMPYWREVRSVILDLNAYLEFLQVPTETLVRGSVDALQLLTRAHESNLIFSEEKRSSADIHLSYAEAIRGMPLNPADANLLLGWCCLRLKLFFETKFCLGRTRRSQTSSETTHETRFSFPVRIAADAANIRRPQDEEDWGPARHLLLLVAMEPRGRDSIRCLVDLSRPGLTPAPLSTLLQVDEPNQSRRLVRISKQGRNLYSLDRRVDPWHDDWIPLTLFDSRTNRPRSHFIDPVTPQASATSESSTAQ